MKILLVEDNADYKKITEYMLGKAEAQAEVVHVACLADGLSQIDQQKFDLVLLDLNLPDSTGLDTVKEMLAKTGRIPVVVLTVTQDKKQAVDAVKLGVEDYLIKGDFDSMTLHRAIHYALARSSRLGARDGKELA